MSARPISVVPAWRWWAGFFVIVAIGGYLTVLAYVEGLPSFFQIAKQFDKVVHFTMAGMLAFFLDGALKRRALFTVGGFAVPLAAVAVLVPAGIEELLQRFSALRTSSIFDFAADVAGVLVFIPLSRRAAQ